MSPAGRLTAGVGNGRGWTFNGVLLRGKAVADRCPHAHKSRAAAKACAETALRRVNKGTTQYDPTTHAKLGE